MHSYKVAKEPWQPIAYFSGSIFLQRESKCSSYIFLNQTLLFQTLFARVFGTSWHFDVIPVPVLVLQYRTKSPSVFPWFTNLTSTSPSGKEPHRVLATSQLGDFKISTVPLWKIRSGGDAIYLLPTRYYNTLHCFLITTRVVFYHCWHFLPNGIHCFKRSQPLRPLLLKYTSVCTFECAHKYLKRWCIEVSML